MVSGKEENRERNERHIRNYEYYERVIGRIG